MNLGHNYIQPEHLLLALISQEDSLTVRALAELDVAPGTLRKTVLSVLRDDLQQEQEGLKTEIRR